MKELVFINTHPPRVGGGCLLLVMLGIQTKKTVYDGMIFQSKKELLTEKEVKKFLKINPTKFFISSHRITMEVPLNDENVKVISFVRNPVNKIRSHYLWSRKVKADDEFPEAREMSFESFVDKFVRGKSNSRVETLLSSFMIKQENFFFPNYKNKNKSRLIEEMISKNKLLLFPVEEFNSACVLLERMFPKFFTDLSFTLDSNWTTKRKLIKKKLLESFSKSESIQDDHKLWNRSLTFLKENINKYFDDEKDFQDSLLNFKKRCLKKKIGQIQGNIINKISLVLTKFTIKIWKFF